MNSFEVRIAATFTAEPLGKALEFLLGLLQWPVQAEFSPFNQVFQELLAPGSSLAQNTKGVNVVLVRLEDLAAGSGQAQKLAQTAQELVSALQSAVERFHVPLVLVICPHSRVALADHELCALLPEIEQKLKRGLQAVKGLHLVGSEHFSGQCSLEEYDNPRGSRLGAVPYTPRFYALLGQVLARIVHRLNAAPHKVIVLDCDQTLWKGVCGEDGPHGIELDAPRKFLQEFMLEQSRAGMVLCLCSKNNEADVWEVFAQRPDMPLKR